MTDLQQIAKSLGDANRLRILRALLDQELCVCELGDSLGLVQSTLSTHLKVLREAGFVVDDKNAKWVSYSLSPDRQEMLRPLLETLPQHVIKPCCLAKDDHRVRDRLDLRQNGCCCVGFGGLQRHYKEVLKMAEDKGCCCGADCQCDCCTCGK